MTYRNLTHIGLASLLWDIGKQYSPKCDVASHLGLFCLHREISSKNEINNKMTPNTPKNESELTQMTTMGESIRQVWVNFRFKSLHDSRHCLIGCQSTNRMSLRFTTTLYECTYDIADPVKYPLFTTTPEINLWQCDEYELIQHCKKTLWFQLKKKVLNLTCSLNII